MLVRLCVFKAAYSGQHPSTPLTSTPHMWMSKFNFQIQIKPTIIIASKKKQTSQIKAQHRASKFQESFIKLTASNSNQVIISLNYQMHSETVLILVISSCTSVKYRGVWAWVISLFLILGFWQFQKFVLSFKFSSSA